jgi:methylmalonyl-CoA/ethylmalonyl-CoA epimerase
VSPFELGLRLHHVGIVVKDIPASAGKYLKFGYEVRTPVIHDPVQTAYVQFLSLGQQSVFIELVTPDGPSSKLANALAKGGGLNHLCYRACDIEAACTALRAGGMMLLLRPVAAAAFPGRRVAWLMGDDRTPVEIVEGGTDGDV